jgi:hypothetical protein
MLGRDSVASYPSLLKHAETALKVTPEQMPCLRGLFTIFMPQETAFNVSTIAMFLVLLLLTIFFFRKREVLTTKSGLFAAFSVVITALLFFSAHSEPYDSLLLAIPAACAWTIDGGANGARQSWFNSFSKGLYVAYPILSWIAFFANLIMYKGLALLGLTTLVFFIASVLNFARLSEKAEV